MKLGVEGIRLVYKCFLLLWALTMTLEEQEQQESEHWDKAVGQFRLALGAYLYPLRRYGQEIYVTGVSEHIVSLAIQMHQRLEGVDEPYIVEPPAYPP